MTILKQMADDGLPLAPEPTMTALRETYERLRTQPPTSAAEIEQVTISFGRILWPYRKAFEALVRAELAAHDHAHVAQRLGNGLRQQFTAFRARGGSLADLHDAQRVSATFTPADQGRLCALLLEARAEATEQVRAAIAEDATAYRRLIATYEGIQHEVDGHLAALERLMERFRAHPEVADDIRETVREFQRGFASLAREPEAHAVCAAADAYRERGEQARAVRHLREARIFV